MLEANPYKPSTSNDMPAGGFPFAFAFWWLIYLHPAVALLLVYASWLLTALSLGRAPGFGEHPDNDLAHSLVHILGYGGILLILAAPVLFPIALSGALSKPFGTTRPAASPFRARLACVTLYFLMLATVAWICYSDPFRVMYWFFD